MSGQVAPYPRGVAEAREVPYSDLLMADYFWSLIRNVEALCAESADLRDRGHHGRALALAIVAVEESTKAQNVLDWDEEARNGERPNPRHAVERQHHRVKSSLAFRNHILGEADYDGPVPEIESEEELEAIVEQMGAFYAEIRQHGVRTARLRERGLYVDLHDEGTVVLRPTDFRAEDVNEYLVVAQGRAATIRATAEHRADVGPPGPLDFGR